MERKKLMAEHQRRIQDELARKKTEAMNNYLDALADDQPDVSYRAAPSPTFVNDTQLENGNCDALQLEASRSPL